MRKILATGVSCKFFFGILAVSSLFGSPGKLLASIEKNINHIDNVDLKFNRIDDVKLELNIFADKQYDLNEKIFVAEGNVLASLKGAKLKSDRLVFNRETKTLKVEGNVSFIKGPQYFKASELKFDFLNGSGEINNVYGVISIDSLSNDLRLVKSHKELIEAKDEIKIMPIKTINLKDGYQIKGGNINKKFSSILNNDNKNGTINNWRISSKKIIINSEGWFSEKISFTNDPLFPTQTRIEANNVFARESGNSTVISCSKSRLIIEDRISVPLLSNREFSKGQELKWLFGLDFKDRDGLFIGRQYQPIKLPNDFSFSFQPQFFIQRAIMGRSNSYVSKSASPISDPVVTNTNLSDLFGLKANLEGGIKSWKIEFSPEITTFDNERFDNGYRYTGSISKNIDFNKIKEVNTSFYTAYRYKSWNGSLGKSDIYYSTGILLDKDGEYKNKKTTHQYNFKIGTGHYEAEAFSEKNLVKRWKTNFFASFKSSYPINRKEESIEYPISRYRYSPVPISPGLTLNSEISASYFLYSKDTNQALFKIEAGPEFTFGKFTRPYLDFTRLSIKPGLKIKDGSSPFKFDNDVDLRTINMELEQQLYGPLLLSAGLEYNIDKRSGHYGRLLNSQTALLIRRRSYGFGIFYQPHNKMGGIILSMNGFSFNETGDQFAISK